jgi:hypothetical protein
MPSAEFEPAILPSERQQTHALDRAATGIGTFSKSAQYNDFIRKVFFGLIYGPLSTSKNLVQLEICWH